MYVLFRWSTIARYLPGRTDNEIKNYWRTHFKKRKPCDHNPKQNTKIQHQTTWENTKSHSSNLEASHEEGKQEKKDTFSESTTSMESDHQQMMIQDHNTPLWSGFVPLENYLFNGLWDMDDQNGCSRMAIQNQATARGGGRGGDHVNYMCSSGGGYIF